MLQQEEKYFFLFSYFVFWTNVILITSEKKSTGKGHQSCKAKLSGRDTIKIFRAVLIWPTCEYAF